MVFNQQRRAIGSQRTGRKRRISGRGWLFHRGIRSLERSKKIERAVSTEIRSPGFVDGPSANDGLLFNDAQSHLFHQFPKVAHRHEMQVGRLMPFVRQRFRHRSSTASKHFETHSPMTKVRHDNQPAFGNSQHFLKQLLRILNLLQSLTQNSEVERIGRNIRQPLTQVGCHHRQSATRELT